MTHRINNHTSHIANLPDMWNPFLPEDIISKSPIVLSNCLLPGGLNVCDLSPSLHLLSFFSSLLLPPMTLFLFSVSSFLYFVSTTGSLRIHPRKRTEYLWHSFFPSVFSGDIMSTPSRIQASRERSWIPTFALILHQSSKCLVSLWGRRQGKERSEASDINTVQCVFIAA